MRNSSLLPVILSMDFVLGNQAKQPCTIKSEINYQLLPSCINQCLWDIGDDDTPPLGGNMGRYIGCVPPFLNGCYCNPDSASLAHSYITSCVDFLCQTSGPDEISKGTSLYASYCTKVLGAEYTPGIVATTNTEVSTTLHSTPSTNPGPHIFSETRATETASPTNSPVDGGDGGGLSRSDKIALGVGIGVGLPATLAALWACIFQGGGKKAGKVTASLVYRRG